MFFQLSVKFCPEIHHAALKRSNSDWKNTCPVPTETGNVKHSLFTYCISVNANSNAHNQARVLQFSAFIDCAIHAKATIALQKNK